MKRHTGGFTLIELMIVIVILGVIAAIAYPSFIGQIQKARRSDAKQSLLDVAAKLEVFYQDNKGYPKTVDGDDMTTLGYDADPFNSPEGYYNIDFINSAATSYSIRAVPVGTQAAEIGCGATESCCGTYQLDHLGQKTVTGATLSADKCW